MKKSEVIDKLLLINYIFGPIILSKIQKGNYG